MPLDPLSAAIVGSVIGSAVEAALTPSAPAPTTGLVRTLPAEAKRGMMHALADGQVRIDGQTFPLSPGVVIRNEYNMVIPPMLVTAPVVVRYQTDGFGAVHRLWILSAAEAALAENR